MCWFQMIGHLSVAPKFAMVTGTLRSAASEISAFLLIFLLIFYAFAVSFHITFGASVRGYRNLTSTFYSLLEAMLGNFDFNELEKIDKVAAPFLFLSFISVETLVLLNVIIAIIAKAHGTMDKSLEHLEDIRISAGGSMPSLLYVMIVCWAIVLNRNSEACSFVHFASAWNEVHTKESGEP